MKKYSRAILILSFVTVLFCNISRAKDTLNVMICTTPAVIGKMNGMDAVAIAAALDINNINRSFEVSKIDAYVNVVGFFRIEYVEGDCMYTMMDEIVTITPPLAELHEKRNEISADVVILIVNEPTKCGYSGNFGKQLEAFIMVHYECLGTNYTMARQLGYILGCGNHELQSGRFNEDNKTAHAFIYEHDDDPLSPLSFTTIMGYTDELNVRIDPNGLKMIPYWSTTDPTVKYNNTYAVGDMYHDNASQIRLALKTVCSYRDGYDFLALEDFTLGDGEMGRIATKRTFEMTGFKAKGRSKSEFHSEKIRLANSRIDGGANVKFGK